MLNIFNKKKKISAISPMLRVVKLYSPTFVLVMEKKATNQKTIFKS